MTFRWQTDEDKDDPIVPDPSPPAHRNHRRLFSILAICAFLAIAAYASYRTLQQRAAAAEARLQVDVLAIHDLALQAVAAGDVELYRTLLSQQPPAWVATQQQLFEDDLLFAGAARLYDLVLLPGAPAAPQVTLDPSLSHATVAAEHTFVITPTAPARQSITLRQIQTLDLGATGWRIAPPPPDFWLPQIVVPGDAFTLRYPQRDEAVALRLYAELGRVLPQICAMPGLDCPPDLHLTVRLVSDPSALPQATQPESLLRPALHVDLPTPSLVGQPVDEAGLAFVARAYAARAVAPLISHLAAYDCCTRGLLARAILERQLHHLDLRPWPLTPDSYEALMMQGLTLGDVLVLQTRDAAALSDETTWRQMLSVSEFLDEALAPGELLSSMETSLDYWLLQKAAPGRFALQWTEFAYARSRSAQRAVDPDLLPSGMLQLTCYDSSAVAIQRYDLQSATWQHGITHAAPAGWQTESVFPLPGDYGNIVKETQRDAWGDRQARYLWIHRGGSSILFETAPTDAGASLFAPYDGSAPHWRYTIASPRQPALRASLEQEWWQMDLSICNGAQCQAQTWRARPHWSPDGSQLLLEARSPDAGPSAVDHTLFRAASRGQNAIRVASGFAPTWLDAHHYVFLRAAQAESGHEVMIAAEDNTARPVATSADFVQLLDVKLPGGRALDLVRLQPLPTAAHHILVHAERPVGGLVDIEADSFLFMLQLTPDMSQLVDIRLLFHSDGALDFRPSPNGRWIAIRDANTWLLFDLQSAASRPLGAVGAPAWSPDGNWLAQSLDYHIMLHAPGLEYRQPIVHQLGDCPFSSLQWLSR